MFMRKVKPKHIARIEELLAADEPYKARDYCMSLIGQYGYSEEVYRYLGTILNQIGSEARAGSYYVVTNHFSPEAAKAIECAVLQFGRHLHQHIRYFDSLDSLPEPVRARLESTLKKAGAKPATKIPSIRAIFLPKRQRKLQNAIFQIGCIATLFIIAMIFIGGVRFWYSMIWN
jgi:hypothetical protein